MFEKLKRFFQGEPPPLADKIVMPVLGTLTWSKDDEAWLSEPSHEGIGFGFYIAGTPEPAAMLVRHATETVLRKEEFIRDVQRFLESETRRLDAFRAEITGLKIERVCLFWPERVDDGMIYFEGGHDDRGWRCDYIARSPKGLGFDT